MVSRQIEELADYYEFVSEKNYSYSEEADISVILWVCVGGDPVWNVGWLS
jgi:hypothetical protein